LKKKSNNENRNHSIIQLLSCCESHQSSEESSEDGEKKKKKSRAKSINKERLKTSSHSYAETPPQGIFRSAVSVKLYDIHCLRSALKFTIPKTLGCFMINQVQLSA
jgi:hypothetical protein